MASAVLMTTGATAEPLSKMLTPPPKPVTSVPDDALAGGGFYLEANTLIRDETNHTVTAEGSVVARYQGRVLRADELDYQTETGIVTAHGHVTVINPDGTTQFATAMTLDKDMSEGVAIGFSTRLQNDVKIAAARTQRRNADVTELDRVIFTPCQVCAENGQSKPTWSIRARKVVEDKARHTLYFQDAVIQVKGVGILYLPAFYTADPSAARKSGFLLPVVTISGSRGFSYEQPYYQVITPSTDITITPQFNTKVNPFLNVDFRKRFWSGVMDIRAGVTDERDFTSGGAKFGALTARSYILSSGQFDLGDHWTWGFTAERASDKLIFEKYSIPDVFTDRGLYAADGGRLISQIDAVRQDQNSYLSIAAISVEGLRPGDIQSTIPTVAPLIEGHYEPHGDILGGRLRIDGSAVALTRDQSPELTGAEGVNSRRATLGLDWTRTFTLDNGLRIVPFVDGRADVYNLSNLASPSPSNATITRAFGDVGADISYPLIKQTPSATWIVEPLAQIAVGPNTHLDPRIPNEDSQVWSLDETNLFEVNHSPGYDLYQGGQSATLAGRATLMLPDGRGGSLLVGRIFQSQDQPVLPLSSGLRTALSDWVVGFSAEPIHGVNLFSRWQLNSTNFGIDRMETGVGFTTSRASGYISYLQESISPTGQRVSSLDIHGEVWATRHWGATIYSIVDGGTWRQNDLGIVYRDDCIRVEVLYRRNETFNGTLGPSSSVVLRLSLATLANTGYTH
ncbi:MAG TPA: LPS assembly protein LptD [Caulobacteraceae bacterium]|jgi:LPS-assembly protein|nr:LPS assembly protein LptD [Caulobacteraceae bacterium]